MWGEGMTEPKLKKVRVYVVLCKKHLYLTEDVFTTGELLTKCSVAYCGNAATHRATVQVK